MLHFGTSSAQLPRRAFLRLGMGGFAGLSLPTLFRGRALAGTTPSRERTALIVIWLQGGASHLETYDPKPNAPSEVRGPFSAIATRGVGMKVSELLPLHARVADRFSLVRSLVHTGFCHQQGNQQLMTGHPVVELRNKSEHPDLMAIVHKLRGDPSRIMPGHVALQAIPYIGAAWLGPAHEPFDIYTDPNQPNFTVPNISLQDAAAVDRLNGRMNLRARMGSMAREPAFDQFHEQAWNMLASPEVARAFDIGREDPRVRDRYGRNAWGQRCLLARRLIEAGVDMVTTSLHGPLCGRVGNWDDHAVNHHVFDAMKARCVYFDRAVATLIEDLHDRGLDRRVMVIVTGEFGRTPKINYQPDSASGVKQPGRDHWPRATSLLFSGGGIKGGQVVGATDKLGGDVTERRVGVRDILATLYYHLGVNADRLTLPDPTGRPIPLLPEGTPIPELVAA